MAKKQSPLAPNPHSPREVHQNPNPNPLGKKQPPPPPNPNLLAKKQPPPPPDNNPNLMAEKRPPPSSSSDQDRESSSASNGGGSVIKKPNTQAPANNQEKEEEEEEEEETGYETESSEDEEGEEVNQPEAKRPQPISTTAAIPALKPRDASEKPNGKDEGNGGDEEGESGSSSDEDEERLPNTKKARAATPVLKPRDGGGKPNGRKGNAGPKTLFQRIWTLEDEIGILKGMTKFEAEHGPVKINPAGIRPFHDFVRDSLSIEVSGSQLYEKVRRLRRKYERRAANRGKTTRFRRAHDEKVYQLSEKIWGSTVPGDDTEAKKGAEPERATTVPDSSEGAAGSAESLKRKYPFMVDALGRSLSAGLMETFYDHENARLLEAHFQKQKVAEIKLKTAAYEKFLEDVKKASTE